MEEEPRRFRYLTVDGYGDDLRMPSTARIDECWTRHHCLPPPLTRPLILREDVALLQSESVHLPQNDPACDCPFPWICAVWLRELQIVAGPVQVYHVVYRPMLRL